MAIIACVFAHPDDEAFGPGGTIAKLANDNHIEIICCTDGDHQDRGLKNIRDKELLASAKILGVKQVHFLDFADGSLCNSLYHQLANQIKEKLDKIKPETLITFDENGVSGHLDHIAVTSVINWLFPKLTYLKKILYFTNPIQLTDKIPDYFVYFPPGRTKADEIVDVSEVWPTKVAAMSAHVSQKSDCDMILGILSDLPKEEWFLVRSKE